MPAHALVGAPSHIAPQLGVTEQQAHVPRGGFNIPDKKSTAPVLDLVPNAPDLTADNCPPLPHSLGYGEPKAFPQRFLENHSGAALKGVDEQRVVGGDDHDALTGGRADRLIHRGTFRIVGSAVAGKHKRRWELLSRHAERIDDALWIFPFVEAAGLHDERQILRDPITVQMPEYLGARHIPIDQ